MAFPPVYTFIGFPYPATPTVASGASYRDIYWPLSQLVDGSGATGYRHANTTGALLFDLGSALPCNFFCVFGHNFDADLVVSVQMSNTPGAGDLLSRGCGVKQPSFWLDLRSLAGVPTTARYLQLSWVAIRRPVTLGEVSIGQASLFQGVLDREPAERVFAPQIRSYLEYGKLITSATGTIGRTMELGLSLDPDQRTLLDAIHAQAAVSPLSEPGDGTRVVVIPSTHRNDAWLVDWPAYLPGEYGEDLHDRIVRYKLTLAEEVFAAR
jgi:hypothetical protein